MLREKRNKKKIKTKIGFNQKIIWCYQIFRTEIKLSHFKYIQESLLAVKRPKRGGGGGTPDQIKSNFYLLYLHYFKFQLLSISLTFLWWKRKTGEIQEMALRFVYDDYIDSYRYLLQKLKLAFLKFWRIRTMAKEWFNILYKQSSSCLLDFIQINKWHILLDI